MHAQVNQLRLEADIPRMPVSQACQERRRNPLYGNEHGLPGLPKTTYVTVGGRRVKTLPTPAPQPRLAPPPLRPRPVAPPPAPLVIPSGPDPTLARRMDNLELRISSTEQSNKTLLDELMRLQQEIKGNVRKNELAIQEERDSRSRLDMALRGFQTRNHEIDDKIRKYEYGIKDNQGAVQQFGSQIQRIEKMISLLQDELAEKVNEGGNRAHEYQHAVKRLTEENEQLNKIVNNLREQAKNNKNRIDNFQDEIVTLQTGLRLQATLIDENVNKQPPPPPRTSGVDIALVEQDRKHNQARITELNSTIQDLTSRLMTEGSKREKMEQDLNNRISQLISELDKIKTEEGIFQKDLDDKMKSLQSGFTESDKLKIRMEMSRVANDLNNKINANDAKIREDAVEKLSVIEATLTKENERRKTKEEELDKILSKGVEEIAKKEDLASENLKTTLDTHVEEHKNQLSSLNKRMNEVEESLRRHKLQQEKLLQAEITERLSSDKVLDAKINDLEDDVQLGFSTLQYQLKETKEKSTSETTRKQKTPPSNKSDVDEIIQAQEQKAARIRHELQLEISEIERKLGALETTIKQKDDKLKNHVLTANAEEKDATSLLVDQMQAQMNGLVFKHNKLNKKVDDLEVNVSETPKDMRIFRDETNVTITELRREVDKETKQRKANEIEFKESIKKIIGTDNEDTSISSLAQLSLEADQQQTALRKCAESIHVTKTILTEKLRDERKIREKQNVIFETDVERLDTKIRELKERMKYSVNLDDTLNDFEDVA